MKGLLHYHLHNYLRSHRYIPPLSLYILSLVINYTYTPNPILDSYSFTSLLLFFIMGWFTVTIFHTEDEGQKRITMLHCKNPRKYYRSLFTMGILIGLCLSLISVVYPIVFNAFGVEMRGLHLIMGFLSHFSLSLLSLSLSALFTRELIQNQSNTWWGVLGILVISVSISTLKDTIDGFIWLFPPLHFSLEIMSSEDNIKSIPGLFWGQFSWIFLYTFLLIGLFFWIMKRKHPL
ncbi:ABC transporter permease [Priestia filamentosa]|uniref:ABC transporter permease n=1 Tax=Priestia filamentosa TaxID=1402861 RepID=UPI003D267916